MVVQIWTTITTRTGEQGYLKESIGCSVAVHCRKTRTQVNQQNNKTMTTKKTTDSTTTTTAIAEVIRPAAIAEVVQPVAIETVNDPYFEDEFADPDPQFPRIQTLRGEGPQPACWFIPEDQLGKAGWLDPDPNLAEYHFAGGDAEVGLVITKPRMLVAVDSPKMAFDRKATQDTKRLVIAGNYNEVVDEENKAAFGPVQFFRIYLLGERNEPLAESPFGYISKGATRATFVSHWQQSAEEIARCHSRSLGKAYSRRNDRYRSLCVFAPIMAKEKVETDVATVMAAKVVDHEKATQENWMSFFLGRNENADWYTEVMGFQPVAAIGGTNQLMLAEG
jgi:hypothetical protein